MIQKLFGHSLVLRVVQVQIVNGVALHQSNSLVLDAAAVSLPLIPLDIDLTPQIPATSCAPPATTRSVTRAHLFSRCSVCLALCRIGLRLLPSMVSGQTQHQHLVTTIASTFARAGSQCTNPMARTFAANFLSMLSCDQAPDRAMSGCVRATHTS